MCDNNKKILLCAFLTTIVVATLSVLFYPVENPDSAARYALMAEAFARGDWYESFHPRFCVLFQVLTGSLTWLLGCSGQVSCQIISSTFMGLSVIPYWYVMRRLFGDSTIAWVSVGILIVIPRISGDAMNGLRDTGRILGLTLWLLGFLRMIDRKSSAWLQAGGLFMLVTLKIDCFLPAAMMCTATVVAAARIHSWRAALSSIFAFLIAGVLVCFMVWSYTGWFVPAPQYIAFLKGLL
jgi:asparagine N-glycosylation enzyme membrane subunit Stt3